ncbi:Glycosidase [Bacteroides luti]|uniref:Glycosidase n=2 Tax=Bacteroides luti TaxID=1297750 RepID=A0A1M5CJ90_9BACE|nr:Glycosidase [Bacteroides luti]
MYIRLNVTFINLIMRKTLLTFILFITAVGMNAASKIDKIDPSFWYVGMKNPELQLMVYGKNISSCDVSVNYPGVHLSSIVKLESPNYLLVYLTLDKDVKAGNIELTFTQGNKKEIKYYELKTRAKKGAERIGFDSSDVLYMLMPDRFANGNAANDNDKALSPSTVDRKDPNARHGGDLAGIEKHLDYFNELGITALWFTPVLENSMTGGSYHGYATTNYYNVDPRFGTNNEYKNLIDKAHNKGLKIVMDMIFNHCGSEHPWLKDMPSHDWFNSPDYEKNFVQTNFKLTPHVDPYSSDYDFKTMNDGWFVRSMPDLNQRNPHVLRYLIQNSFWWIEFAGIDGIRMDTYPYADFDGMAKWMKEINEEYPNFNVVGESWVTEPAYTAYWQKDSKLAAPRNSNLKTVMDFSFYDKINQAKNEESTEDWKGLNRIYNNFVYDYLYPNPLSVMAFLDNHDTNRFLEDGNDIAELKQAVTLLLTIPRIPQLYYGTEIMMNGRKNVSDGYVRKDFPGGWAGDAQNAFTREGRTPIQNEIFDYISKLLHWRKDNAVISEGTMKHFIPQNGIYVYVRSFEGKAAMVILNGTNKEQVLPIKHYNEVLNNATTGKDIISEKNIDLTKDITLNPKQSMIIEL